MLSRKFCASKSPTFHILNVTTHLRKTFYILLIAIIFTSCDKEKKLNGTWISAYEIRENDTPNYDLSGIPFNEIWEFKDGTLNIREFKFDAFEDSLRSFNFKINGNKFIVNENEPYLSNIIEPIAKDSFQLSGFSYGNTKLIYKRLNDSLKNKSTDFKLTGNKYIRNFKKWTDTIHFVNDSVFKSSGWKQGNSDLMWERVNINGFDILFTDIYIPFVLTGKNDDRINVTTFDWNEEKYILEQIE